MQNLDDLFYYDETSPSGLRHKVDKYVGRGLSRISSMAGDFAGYKCTLNNMPYWAVKWKGIRFLVHRIIMAFDHKLEPGLVVDHIDGNGLNNTITNLRVVTRRTNLQNRKRSSNNSSGATGVSWHKHVSVLYAKVAWQENGKKYKYFSSKKLGLLPAFAIACKFREAKIAELKANGANYTDRHGI